MSIEVKLYPLSRKEYELVYEQHSSDFLQLDPDYKAIMGETIELFLSDDEIADVESILDILHLADESTLKI